MSEADALLVRCAAADAEAFRRVYELNGSRLYGVALGITRNPQLASDAVHDAMLQVWHHASRYDPERGNADAWLVSLVRCRALDISRRHEHAFPGVYVPEQLDDPAALSRVVSTADGDALHICLAEVEAGRHKLVLLAFINGLTYAEVAAQLGRPLGTIKSSIRRALIAVRKQGLLF